MSKKVFNMPGGLHSADAYSGFENRAYGSCVANAASFVVTPGTGMNLSISTGDGLISVDAFSAKRIQTTTAELAAVPAASASFSRIDTLVAYIDNTVTPTTAVVDNINDILKFKVVAGTAATTPVAPTGAAIQSSIGAGSPYMTLYNVLLPQSALNVSGVTLTDLRMLMATPAILDGIVTSTKLANNAVTATKVANGAIGGDKISASAITIGYASTTTNQAGLVHINVDLSGLSFTVVVPAGGRRVELSFVIPTFSSTGGSADQCRIFFQEGATVLSSATNTPSNAFGHLFNGAYVFMPSEGTHTYKLTYIRTNGTGSGATNAAADAVCYFTARLV